MSITNSLSQRVRAKRRNMSKVKYKRVLLKLSGEALVGKSGFGIDVDEAEAIASRIKEVF
jgi:hypothetical protein